VTKVKITTNPDIITEQKGEIKARFTCLTTAAQVAAPAPMVVPPALACLARGSGSGGYGAGGWGSFIRGTDAGVGGSSFDAGRAQILIAQFQTGNGEVVITEPPAAVPEPACDGCSAPVVASPAGE